ncbi:MAG TPA: Hsp20/alpha crystallin family protein [Candidatus Sulfotelmatobacter sp.]|nr:Hsp20/alpha crystallin family protein [Candidatus Sulfotelmatobacter sp.]
MSDISTSRLQRLHGQLGELVYEMMKLQFSHFKPASPWAPSLNVYRGEHCITVCLDLAGVEKDSINLKVEPQRLLVRGRRAAPEPDKDVCKAVQVLAMEIDYGPFERELTLSPMTIDTARVTANHKNGLLWIYLPLRAQA